MKNGQFYNRGTPVTQATGIPVTGAIRDNEKDMNDLRVIQLEENMCFSSRHGNDTEIVC